MKYKMRWVIIIAVIAWSLYSMFPLKEKINLGLDLQGGMHVVLGVETDKAVEAKIESYVIQIRNELNDEKINFSYVQKTKEGKVQIGLADDRSQDKIREIMEKRYSGLQESGIDADGKTIAFSLTEEAVKKIKENAVKQSLEVVRNRVDEFGVAEPVIQRQGKEQVVVELPGVTDPDRAIKLIGRTAQLKFYIVDDKVSAEDLEAGNIPFDDIILYQKKKDRITGKTVSKVPFALKREAVLTGEYIVDANVIFNNMNMPIVSFKLDAAGSKLFAEVTGQNVGKRMAIVLDGNVNSAPTINARIAGGSAIIEGRFTMEEAQDTAIVLRAGSLPAPVVIEENRTVGPSLGFDSIQKGVKAAGIGLILIIIFMAVYYRLSGLVANLALGLNFVIILGVMSQLGATLTLPGIAGIILTIGMSVDANVLIFERVREELRQGRTPYNALEFGYEKAFVTIIDANITTIIAAVVLFQFGTGPIKGFAVTLSIGILASLFTAIFVTRTVFSAFLSTKAAKKLSI